MSVVAGFAGFGRKERLVAARMGRVAAWDVGRRARGWRGCLGQGAE